MLRRALPRALFPVGEGVGGGFVVNEKPNAAIMELRHRCIEKLKCHFSLRSGHPLRGLWNTFAAGTVFSGLHAGRHKSVGLSSIVQLTS